MINEQIFKKIAINSAMGYVAGELLDRPKLMAATLLQAASIIKDVAFKALSQCSCSMNNFTQHALDLALPYAYWHFANNVYSDWTEKHDLDFCLPGSITGYFWARNVLECFDPKIKIDKASEKHKQFSNENGDLFRAATAAFFGVILILKEEDAWEFLELPLMLGAATFLQRKISRFFSDSAMTRSKIENLLKLFYSMTICPIPCLYFMGDCLNSIAWAHCQE